MTWVALAAVALAAAALRAWRLDEVGFNSDEAVYSGQAAAIAGDPALGSIFPVFRAHPLLFQFLVGVVYRLNGVSDLSARVVAISFGVATIIVVYHLGAELYGRVAGLLSATFLAAMPYHVVVTRQALLDGPMVFFATLALYTVVRYARTQRAPWLYASGAAMGLTFLAKETSIVLLPAIYVFLALSPTIKVKIRDIVIASLAFVAVVAPYPITLLVSGAAGTGRSFLVWQLFRPANHPWTFYPRVVPAAIGLALVGAAALSLWLDRRRWSIRERSLVVWIAVPVAFFWLWPVKGFQYLLPVAPAIAVLGARAFARPVTRRAARRPWLRVANRVGAVAVAATLVWSSVGHVSAVPSTFLAGAGGLPAGREAGTWALRNVPRGASMLTIGPSMANVLQFYGHVRAFGLSVSPNPLHRNPVYDPVRNPDLLLRTGEIQYVVWDAYSAERSTFFANKLLRYVRRYEGVAVHTESLELPTPDGASAVRPVIVIYEVTP